MLQRDFPLAGHSILLPYIPTTYTDDGQPEANAQANEQSWQAVVEFLHNAVAERRAHSKELQ